MVMERGQTGGQTQTSLFRRCPPFFCLFVYNRVSHHLLARLASQPVPDAGLSPSPQSCEQTFSTTVSFFFCKHGDKLRSSCCTSGTFRLDHLSSLRLPSLL